MWTITIGSVVVTPSRQVPLGGFVARVGNSTGILDDLEANLIVLTGADAHTIAWVAIDALAVMPELRTVVVDAVVALTNCTADQVVVTASHTHSAPSGWVGQILPALPAPVDDELLADLGAAIAGMPLRSTTVRLETFSAAIDGVGSNRARPDGPFDPTSVAVMARDDTGVPVALLYDFACHPTVLGPDSRVISADWVGAARRALRRGLGADDLPVVFAQGCAGDVSTRFYRQGRLPPEVDRLGSRVAEWLLAAAGRAEPLAGNGIRLRHDVIELPSRWAPDSTVTVPISSVDIGVRRWLTVPGEVVASFGIDITAALPRTRLVSCTDGYIGYLADANCHADGSYEASASPLTLSDTLEVFRRVEKLGRDQ